MLDRWRKNALARLAHAVCDHPVLVLTIALTLAAGSIAWTAARLRFQSDRNDLISPNLDWNARYIRYRTEFEGKDRVVVVVRVPTTPGGAQKAERFVDAIDVELTKLTSHVNRVWSRIESRPILVRLLPLEPYRERMAEMTGAGPLLNSRSVSEFITALTAELRRGESDPSEAQAVDQLDQLQRIVQAIRSAAGGADPRAALADAGLGTGPGYEYLASEDGTYLFLDIDLRASEEGTDPYAPGVADVQGVLERLRIEHPDFDAGLTGIPVMEADETTISMRDSTLSSIYASVLIALLLIWAYHGWRLPLLAVVSLFVGVAWTFGFLTLAIGYLQVLSVVFTVILLGLGIDFGVHLMSRFELIRHRYPDSDSGFREALVDTMQTVGPGMITGAVTSAVAFSTTALTDFKGMAEMGVIAGVGLLLCLVAMWAVFPAVLRLVHHRTRHVTPPMNRWFDLHGLDYLNPIVRHPWLTVVLASLVAVAGTVGVWHVRFDNNVLNMMSRNTPSVRWLTELENAGLPLWDAVAITDDLDTARRWTEELRAKRTVADVGGIGRLFPADEAEKLALAEQVRRSLGRAIATEPVTDVTPPPEDTPVSLARQLDGLAGMLRIALTREDVLASPAIADAMRQLVEEVRLAAETLESERSKRQTADRIGNLQAAFRESASAIRDRIRDATDTRPLVLGDLPGYLQRDSISRVGPLRYVVKAYPVENVWEPEPLARFVHDVRSVAGDGNVTGSPIQIHESGLLMHRSYQHAGLWAILVVLLLVWLDMRSLADTLLCLVPVTWAFLATFGVMYLAGVPINPANLIVLPMLFGIGVANGVNIVFRYRLNPFARPLGLAAGTGKSIPLTSGTTIIAFATMIPSEHLGIRSLGFVLTVGISFTLLASMTLMPALLEIRNRCRARRRRLRRS